MRVEYWKTCCNYFLAQLMLLNLGRDSKKKNLVYLTYTHPPNMTLGAVIAQAFANKPKQRSTPASKCRCSFDKLMREASHRHSAIGVSVIDTTRQLPVEAGGGSMLQTAVSTSILARRDKETAPRAWLEAGGSR